MPWFDAHLDLAYLEARGRDMRGPLDPAAGPHPPASVTLGSLAEGSVEACLATIFTEPVPAARAADEPGITYRAGDAESAAAAGHAQLAIYDEWQRAGRARRFGEPGPGLAIGILVEGADPIRGPRELAWWKGRGVVAIGLTWARGSRYAAGNAAPAFFGERGLTGLGREMVAEMDRLGLVHDLSHLSRRATDELLALTDGRVMASHSNVARLVEADNERHLRDEVIEDIARRGGIIGLNLFSAFLEPGISPARPRRASLAACIRHVERIAELAGDRSHIGLGSDMDGGFSAALLPDGIDRPADLGKLLAPLRAAGWTEPDLEAFSWGNWARFWGLA